MTKTIGEVIAFYRKKSKLSQLELTHELAKYQINVKNAAVSSWEKNTNVPTAKQLLALCEILGIIDIYGEFIGELPNQPIGKLNDFGKERVNEYINLLLLDNRFVRESNPLIPFPIQMRVSTFATSAGTGDFMDDENFEIVDIFEAVPSKTDFGVRLNGDSMEPRYKDNQLVWIEQTDYLTSGEIGLFYLDGKTYCKQFYGNDKGTYLLSLNSKYPPIPVKDFSSFRIFGKVLN